MNIRAYCETDRQHCVAIFDSNSPDLIAPGERLTFQGFLEHPIEHYFVMEHDGEIVGCGGYTVNAARTEARLAWGMVRRNSQRLGLGRFLLLFRLREIGKEGNVSLVQVETPLPSAAFFEKQGFRTGNLEPNRPATDGGRIALVKRLAVCA